MNMFMRGNKTCITRTTEKYSTFDKGSGFDPTQNLLPYSRYTTRFVCLKISLASSDFIRPFGFEGSFWTLNFEWI